MNHEISRRSAIKVTALTGGGLALSWTLGGLDQALANTSTPTAGAGSAVTELGPFVRLRPDNVLEFVLDRVEMGQGTATSQAMLLCEELEYPVSQVEVLHATADSSYNNSKFFAQMTGGSTSVAEGHEKLRRAGAEVRERLRHAAAEQWKKDVSKIVAADGKLTCSEDKNLVATYGQFASQAAKLSKPKFELKPWTSHSLIGKSTPRIDARAKSTGKAVYSIDFAPPGSAVAVLVRPPKIGARFAAFEGDVDAAAAQKLPGVLTVVTTPSGVAVIAESYWQAKAAAAKITVRWDESQAFQLSSAEILDLHRKASQTAGSSARSAGDYAKAYRAATKKILADYELPYLAHATMEPQSATCLLRSPEKSSPGGLPRVEVWASTQVPDVALSEIAEVMECKRSEVALANTYLGGGFGRKLKADAIVEVAQIAKAAHAQLGDRPVKLVFSREDDMRHDDYRPMAVCHLLGSVDADGKLSSLFFRCASQSLLRKNAGDLVQALSPQWIPTGMSKFIGSSLAGFGEKGVALEGARDTAYRCPNIEVQYTEVDLPIRVGFWRSVGHSITGFVVESFIDELAHLAGVDPYRFRRAHLENSDRRAGVLDKVAQIADWGKPLPAGVFEGIAVTKAFDSYVAQVCRISVDGSQIRVLDFFTAIDCGRVVNPDIVRAQIESGIVYGLSAALTGAIDFDRGAVVQGNFHEYEVLRHSQCPRMVTEIMVSEELPTGVGELGTPLVAACVCNALFRASGQRIRSLPLSRSFKVG
jgi:isoquinoline 1-oxidoreductase beta subunit